MGVRAPTSGAVPAGHRAPWLQEAGLAPAGNRPPRTALSSLTTRNGAGVRGSREGAVGTPSSCLIRTILLVHGMTFQAALSHWMAHPL